MGLLSELKNFFVGGGTSMIKDIGDIVKDYLPPDIAPEKKFEMELRMKKLEYALNVKTMEAIGDAERNLNRRISDLEGTAKDLMAVPVLGNLMLFLRGCQRPIWGFATMYIDHQVFSGAWVISDEKLQSAFWVLNLLVTGFLFGERAVKNVVPMVGEYITKTKTKVVGK